MSRLRAPSRIALLMFAVSIAATAAAPNSEPVYRTLREALPAETFLVENIVLKRDQGFITLKSGTLAFTPKVKGRDTVAVFEGEGVFAFQPAFSIEKDRLKTFAGGEVVMDTFDRALLCFTDHTGDEIRGQGHAVAASPKLADILRDFRKQLRSRPATVRSLWEAVLTSESIDNIEADLLGDLYNSAQPGFFSIYMHGKHASGLRYHVKPRGVLAMLPAPEEVALIDFDPDAEQEGVWCLEHLQSELAGRGASSGEEKRVAQALEYQIDTNIAGNGLLTASAKIKFKAVSQGDRVIKLALIPSLRVSKVESGGKEIPFIQEGRREDASFYVVMPEAMARGSEHELSIEYESEKGALQGDKVIVSEGGGNFAVGARESWYPSLNAFRDHAMYDLTFHVPKQYTLVSVGKLVEQAVEKGEAMTHWKSEAPIPVAGFNYGTFKKKEITDAPTGMHVEGYAGAQLPDYLAAAPMALDAVGTMSPSALNESAIVEAQNALRLYSSWFGKSEFSRIAITQQPQMNFGQSWPELVYLPLIAYLDSTQRWRLFNGIQHRMTEFVDEVGPHEVSHQWWGHMVGWQTFHDQWLSEGFAEFSAGLYLQGSEKTPAKYLAYWDHARHAIVDKNQYGKRANDAGPLWLGLLLNSFKNEGAYNSVVYRKGGYVLHMLRSMMYDPAERDKSFMAMMHDFVTTFMNGNATTESFQRIVEKHITPGMNLTGDGKLDWFFKEWVYGTWIPRYKFDYKLEDQAGGKCLLVGALTQSDVPKNFAMLVPLYAEFDGQLARLATVRMIGESTADNIKVLLPKRPSRAAINAFHDVLEQ
jgi:Peptidase family M1 domain